MTTLTIDDIVTAADLVAALDAADSRADEKALLKALADAALEEADVARHFNDGDEWDPGVEATVYAGGADSSIYLEWGGGGHFNDATWSLSELTPTTDVHASLVELATKVADIGDPGRDIYGITTIDDLVSAFNATWFGESQFGRLDGCPLRMCDITYSGECDSALVIDENGVLQAISYDAYPSREFSAGPVFWTDGKPRGVPSVEGVVEALNDYAASPYRIGDPAETAKFIIHAVDPSAVEIDGRWTFTVDGEAATVAIDADADGEWAVV